MAQIKFTVCNCNTGKVLYSGIKMSGDFQALYDKLLQVANRIFFDLLSDPSVYIYGYPYWHRLNSDGFSKLLCAHGRYYFKYRDSASISYTYSII